ncbi:hypothetical protein ACH5RR_019085 [Cinchona calisaya]|uniref:Transmembrane protein n=1 Tax=Cinchona calisaya TaxID=153742 RepID=A0ABD2ZNF0_9GENT
MAATKCNFLKKLCIFMGVMLFITLISFQEVEAMRPLVGDLWFKKNLIIQSLPKGSPVNTPSPNPCTFIPGSSNGRCTLAQNEEKPHAFPHVMVQFGAASKENGTTTKHPKKDQSSS